VAPRTSYDKLIEIAAQQHGFVRTADAEDAGVKPVYLRKLAAAGRAKRLAQGLYRVNVIPSTPLDEYREAVLRARGEGVVAGDAALALWELADVNPRTIDVVLPAGQQVRRKVPDRFRVRQRRLAPADIDYVDGIPVMAAKVAIEEAIAGGLAGDIAAQAIATARRRELISQLTEARLLVKLADRNEAAHRAPRVRRNLA